TSTWSFCNAVTATSMRVAVSRFWRSHRDCSQPGCRLSSWRCMLDAHRLRRILPHRFDQIHLLLDQVAVSDQLLHLPFFRNQLFPLRVLQLLLCPDQFLVDLISLTRIWRIAPAHPTQTNLAGHILATTHVPPNTSVRAPTLPSA